MLVHDAEGLRPHTETQNHLTKTFDSDFTGNILCTFSGLTLVGLVGSSVDVEGLRPGFFLTAARRAFPCSDTYIERRSLRSEVQARQGSRYCCFHPRKRGACGPHAMVRARLIPRSCCYPNQKAFVCVFSRKQTMACSSVDYALIYTSVSCGSCLQVCISSSDKTVNLQTTAFSDLRQPKQDPIIHHVS